MTALQIVGVGALALGAILLLALLGGFFRLLAKLPLTEGAIITLVVILAAVGTFAIWPRGGDPLADKVHVHVAAPHATSAAVAVRRFLVTLLAIKVVGGIAVALGWQWWKARQKRAKLQEMLEKAQLYALLDGRPPQRPVTARRLGQGGNVIVVGGQAPVQQPAPTWEVVE
jgi:hypothetical protein